MPASSTVKQYNSLLNRLKTVGYDIKQLESNPIVVIKWIHDTYSSLDSQNTYLNAIVYRLRLDNVDTVYAKPYLLEVQRLRPLRAAKGISQVLPDSKIENMIPWPEILALKPKAKEILDASDYLLYLFYTEIPPLRADFSNLKVFPRALKSRKGNYIISSVRLANWRLVLQEYKTSNKYGKQTIALPVVIAEALKNYVSDHPEGYLIGVTEAALSKRVISLFNRLTGKNTSINLLRHSYINHYLSKQRTLTERTKIALAMLHSPELQERYNLIGE